MEAGKTTEPKTCEKHGEYEAKYTPGYGTVFPPSWTKCPVCAKEADDSKKEAERAAREAEMRDREAMKREMRIESYWENSNIPVRYQCSEWDSYERITGDMSDAFGRIKSYAENLPENAAKGRGLLLNGLPGTGKTMLACLVAKDAIKKHAISAVYQTAKDIFLKIRASYRKEAETSEDDLIRWFGSRGLLVIDEIGVQKGSESELETLQHLIDRRYQNMKPTILISNLPIDQWPQFLGQRGLDRMRENGGQAIAFTWGSFRK